MVAPYRPVEAPQPDQSGTARIPFPWNRWHAPIVAAVAASYAKPTYIEIGVYRGDCLAVVAPVCGEAHGVDVSFDRLTADVAGARLWEMTSDAFFESYDGPRPDIVLVDGDHAYEQARRDVHNALGALADGGVVFVHDSWPVFRAATDRLVCGGVHRVIEELHADERLEVATIRRWPGLSVVTKRGPALMDGSG